MVCMTLSLQRRSNDRVLNTIHGRKMMSDKVYEEAVRGREIWIKFKEKYRFNPEEILLVIYDLKKSKYVEEVNEYLKELVAKKEYKQIYLFACSNIIGPDVDVVEVMLSEDEMKCIQSYCRLIKFAPHIRPIIYREPFGNLNMIDYKGITIKEYLRG